MAAWISLVEYSHKHQISLSTLRRYIKAGKLTYRKTDGRYLIHDDQATHRPAPRFTGRLVEGDAGGAANVQNDQDGNLTAELLRAREEIAELRTLIALYEEKMQLNELQTY